MPDISDAEIFRGVIYVASSMRGFFIIEPLYATISLMK